MSGKTEFRSSDNHIELSFKQYIAAQPVTDSMQGDFLRDAKGDAHFPDAQSWDELERYLKNNRSCGGAIKSAKLVWGGYKAANP